MPASWDVEIEGHMHTITVDRAESGKDVIKVDGRTAARPMGPDDHETEIAIGFYRYAITRSGDEFEIRTLQDAEGAAAEASAAAAAAGPVYVTRSGSQTLFMRFGWIFILGLIAGIGWLLFGPNYAREAGKRVQAILEDIKDGPSKESSVSAALWAKNVRELDQQELASAEKEFASWREEKGFVNGCGSPKIVHSEKLKGTDVPTALVTFECDGGRHQVIVPQGRPIQWAE